jgi:alpha-galactosidase
LDFDFDTYMAGKEDQFIETLTHVYMYEEHACRAIFNIYKKAMRENIIEWMKELGPIHWKRLALAQETFQRELVGTVFLKDSRGL